MPYPKDADVRLKNVLLQGELPPGGNALTAAMRRTVEAIAQPLTDAHNRATHARQDAPVSAAATTAQMSVLIAVDTAPPTHAASHILR